MVEIVTGAGLGLLRSSASLLGASGTLGSAVQGRARQNVTLNAATGNLVIRSQDEVLSGVGPDAVINHTYNSLGQLNSPNNSNWTGIGSQVQTLTGDYGSVGSSVTRLGWDGSIVTYTWNAAFVNGVGAAGAYTVQDQAGAYDSLIRADSIWTWHDGASALSETYEQKNGSSAYLVTKKTDLNGQALSYEYNPSTNLLERIRTSNGESTRLTYNGSDPTSLVTQRLDGSQLTRVNYGYDPQHRLTSVTVNLNPDGLVGASASTYVTTYTYDDATNRIASITQTDGSRLELEYDNLGRVKKFKQYTTTTAFRATTITYGAGTSTITALDSAGNAISSTLMTYDSANRLISVRGPVLSNGRQQVRAFEYDGDGRVRAVSVYDSLNFNVATNTSSGPPLNQTLYTYDVNANILTKSTWGNGTASSTQAFTYDSNNNLLTSTQYAGPAGTTPAGSPITRYFYDNSGNLRFMLSPQRRVVEYRYDARGQQVAQLDHAATYGGELDLSKLSIWTTSGVGSAIARRTDTTYDFRGNVQSVTAFSATTTDGYGDRSRPMTVTSYFYDQSGQMLSKLVNDGSLTETYAYDGLGRLIRHSDGNGAVTRTSYLDATNQTQITLANGLVTTTTYDGLGEVTGTAQSQTPIAYGADYDTNLAPPDLASWSWHNVTAATAPAGAPLTINGAPAVELVAQAGGGGAAASTLVNVENGDTYSFTVSLMRGVGTYASDTAALQIFDLQQFTNGLSSDSTATISGPGTLVQVSGALWAISGLQSNIATTVTITRKFNSLDAGRANVYLYADNAEVARANYNIIAAAPTVVRYRATSSAPALASATDWARINVSATSSTSPSIGRAATTRFEVQSDGGSAIAVAGLSAQAGDVYTATVSLLAGTSDNAALGLSANLDGYGLTADSSAVIVSGPGVLTQTSAGLWTITGLSQTQATRITVRRLFNQSETGGIYLHVDPANSYRVGRFIFAADAEVSRLTPVADPNSSFVGWASHNSTTTNLSINGAPATLITSTASAGGAALSTPITVAKDDVYTVSVALLAGSANNAALQILGPNEAGTSTATLSGPGTLVRGGGAAFWEVQGLSASQPTVLTVRRSFAEAGTGRIYLYANWNNGSPVANTTIYAAAPTIVRTPPATQAITTSYRYDMLGNLRIATDADGVRSYYFYDNAGRRTGAVDGTGTLTTYSYDAADRLIGQVTYASPLSVTQRASLADANGDPTLVTLASVTPANNTNAIGGDRRSWNIYDQANRLIETITTTGGVGTGNNQTAVVTGYIYDALGRLTRIVAYAATLNSTTVSSLIATPPTTTYGATLANEAADRVTRNFYDDDNLLIGTLDAEGYLSQIDYNAAGQRVHSVRYAKQNLNPDMVKTGDFTALQAAAISAATAAQDQHDYAFYDGRGLMVASIDGVGNVTNFTYDAGGYLIRREQGRQVAAGTAVTLLQAQTAAIVTVLQVTEYAYDGEGRVVSETRKLANNGTTIMRSSYDLVGNLIAQTTTDTTYATVGSSATVDSRSSYSSFDQHGRILRSLSGAGITWLATTYGATPTPGQIDDAFNRYGIFYTYDAAGLLTSRSTPNGTGHLGGAAYTNSQNKTLFLYDDAGRLRYTVNPLGEVSETQYDAFGGIKKTVTFGTRLTTAQLAGVTGGLLSATAGTLTSDLAALGNTTTQAPGGAASDTVTTFDYYASGTLAQTTDARSNLSTFAYDAFGGRTSAQTPGAGSASVQTTSTYDRRGLLTSVTADAVAGGIAAQTIYAYDAFGNVRRTTDALGRFNASDNVYDQANRLIKGYDRRNQSVSFTYDAFGNIRTSTDARGSVSTFSYDAFSRTLTATTPDSVTTTTTRNAFGQTIRITDGEQRVTSYTYDADGNLKTTEQTPAAGTTIQSSNTYDAAGRLYDAIDARGIVTRYSYDAAGRVLTRIEDFGTTGTTNPVTNANFLNLTTTYTYDAKGEVLTVTDPTNVVTAYTYDESGQTLRVIRDYGTGTAYLNLETRFTYRPDGSVSAQYEGVVTATNGSFTYQRAISSTYDNLGRLIRRETASSGGALSNAEQFAYDKNGNLVATSDNNGHITRFVHDELGRVVYTALPPVTVGPNDVKNYVILNVYDANGNVTITRRFTTSITLVTPNMSDLATVKLEGAAFATLTESSNDQAIYNTFDKENRVVYSAVDGAFNAAGVYERGYGYVTQTIYDGAGNVQKTIRYANRVQILQININSTAFLTPDPAKDVVTTYAYDGANRLTDVTTGNAADGSLSTTHYNLDLLGQITGTIVNATGADKVETRRTFDAAGRVITETRDYGTGTNPATGLAYINATTRFTYDALGRVATQTDPANIVTVFTYDAAGRLSSQTVDPDRPAVNNQPAYTGLKIKTSYAYDALGNKLRQTDPNGNTGYFYYDQLNRLILQIDPNGYATGTSYYLDDLVGSVTRYTTKLTFGAGGVSETSTAAAIMGLLGTAGATTTFGYDEANRLIRTTDALQKSELYKLDALGNRIEVTNRLSGTTTFTYDALGRVLTESIPIATYSADGTQLLPNTVTNRTVYDARGNRIRTIEAEGTAAQRTTAYEYDALDRMTAKTEQAVAGQAAQGARTTYAYDVRGNLILVTAPDGGKTFTYYDGNNRKIAEVRRVGLAGDTTATAMLTRFGYDANGNLKWQQVFGDLVTVPSAAGGTAPAAVDAANVRETQYDYDANNRLVATKVGNTVSTGQWNGTSYAVTAWVSGPNAGLVLNRRSYDQSGNLQTETDGNGGIIYHYYDAGGRETGRIDQRGFVTAWERDAEGNVVTETRFANAYTQTQPPVGGVLPPLPTADAARDRVTTFTYDKNGRRLTETRVGVVSYSVAGSAVTSNASTAATISYTYNELGAVLSKQEATGDTVNYEYDNFGRLRTQRDAALTDFNNQSVRHTTQFFYDGLGNVVRSVESAEAALTPGTRATAYAAATDRVTRYAYVGGVLASVTDAENFTRNLSYDAAGRITRQSWTRVRANGTSATEASQTSYDLAGRVVEQGQAVFNGTDYVLAAGASQVAYNGYGDTKTRSIGGVVQERFEYDAMGRVARSNSGDGVWKLYGYDGAGNATLTIASAGRDLSAVSLAASDLQTLSRDTGTDIAVTVTDYDARGQATVTRELNRQLTAATKQTITRSRTYNAFGEVSSETGARAGQVTDYDYNTLGRVVQRKGPVISITRENGAVFSIRATEDYFYDAAGRLIATRDANANDAIAAGGATQGYLTTRTLLAGTGYGGTEAKVLNEYRPGTTERMTYDAFGDMRERYDGLNYKTSYSYDKLGRLTQSVRPVVAGASAGFTETFGYDGLGQRITRAHIDPRQGLWAEERTDYDVQGRVVQLVDFHAYVSTSPDNPTLNAAPFRVTNYGYDWDSSLVTAGLGAFGGWRKTTERHVGTLTQALGTGVPGEENTAIATRTATEYTDAFGHAAATADSATGVSRIDLGGNTYRTRYDKGGRIALQLGVTAVTTSALQNLTYTNFNSGRVGQITDTGRAAAVTATYGYDGDGNRVLEQYGAGSAAGATGYGNATAGYDLLNRLTWFDDTGSATRPLARIDNEYDAGGNVRRTKAKHGNLDTNGAVLAGTTTDDHWYKYDAQNRFVTTKGVIKVGGSVLTGDAFDAARAGWAAGTGSGTIERGTRGVDLTYDAAGQRKTATQWAYLTATVRDPHPPGPITPENTPPDPATPVVTMEVGYQGTRTEIYGYDAAGYLTTVSFADQGYDDDDQGHAIANATTIDYVRGRYERDLMGRITAAREYAEGGAQIVQQRTNIAYEHGSSRVESDWVQRWQRANGGSTSYANQGITLSNYTYDGMDQLRLINGGNYAVGATPGIALPQTNHQTAYDYIYRESALQSQVTSKAKISDTSTHTSSTTSYDANGFVTQVVTTGQNARTMSYTTDVAGQVIRRSQLTGGSTNGPAVFSTYLSGMKLGEVSNDGTDNTDFATAVNAQATARGPGAFRGGATAGTPAADFDQSYASITPGSTTPVSGSYTVRAGDTLAAIAAGLWGDASLWYLLAEANGLSGPNASLSAGQALTVPNKVTNFHNTSSTFRPYDPNKALGDVQPGAPTPPKKDNCAVIGQIILAAIAVAVTIIALPEGAPTVIEGLLAGFAGAAASQTVGVITGLQKTYDFKGIALAAIGGGVTAGLGNLGAISKGLSGISKVLNAGTVIGDVARGVLSSGITQGIGVATGLQDRFDWTGVAVAGVVSGVGGAVSRGLASSNGIAGIRAGQGSFGNNLASGVTSAIAGAATRSLITGTDFGDNIIAVLPDAIGSTIGRAVGEKVQRAVEDAQLRNEAVQWLRKNNYSEAAARKGAKELLASPIANAGERESVQTTIERLRRQRGWLDQITAQAAAAGADKTERFRAFKYRAELAILSSDIYLDRTVRGATGDYRRLEGAEVAKLTKGALAADRLVDNASGYYSGIYLNEKTGQLIYANRGTEGPGDFTADVDQSQGKSTPQYRLAIRNARDLRDNGIRVTFTGHSLGGGLATAQAIVSGYKALVFNPAGVHANTVGGAANLARQDENGLVTNVTLNGDPLALAQDNAGTTSTVVRGLGWGADYLLGPIFGPVTRQATDAAADALRNAPRAGGQRVPVQPGYATRNARTGQIVGVSLYPVLSQTKSYHSINAVINGLFGAYLTGK